ncbi:MAG: hypothetical protein QW557_03390, partial [Candidatus Nitrosocaldus sp.]
VALDRLDEKGSLVEFISSILKDADPASSLSRRISRGSANPSEQKRMIDAREERSREYRARISVREERLKDALASLQESVGRFIKHVEQ